MSGRPIHSSTYYVLSCIIESSSTNKNIFFLLGWLFTLILSHRNIDTDKLCIVETFLGSNSNIDSESENK